jgi:hypothetical protein
LPPPLPSNPHPLCLFYCIDRTHHLSTLHTHTHTHTHTLVSLLTANLPITRAEVSVPRRRTRNHY